MAVIIPIETKYNPRGVQTAIRNLDEFKAAVDKAGGGISGFAKVTGRMMQQVGSGMQNAGRDMSMGVTLPLVGIGVAAVAAQAQFEQTMASMQVNSGATGQEMTALSNLAKQMGADTVYSANEAAAAMLELSKGGLQPAQISGGALASTLNLAATEGIALDRAATIVAQSMNTFGLSAKESAKVTDLLAAGAVASTAGVEDLASGIKYAGSTAAALKFPMEDVVTSLAAMNNAGIDATTAGTSLNRFMLGLIPTTSKSAKMMNNLGLSFTNAKGELLPMNEVIGRLRGAVSGLGDDQRQAALKAMFGVEGMRVANVLLAQGTDGYNALKTAVTEQGVAQEMANARMSGTAGAMERLKGSIETAFLAIGEALAPIITKVAAFIQTWVDRFQALDPSIQKVIVVVGILAAAIGPLLVVMGMVVSAVGTIIAGFGAVSAPVLAVIAVIAAVIAIVVALWAKSEAFRDAVMAVWNTVRDAVSAAIDRVKAKIAENEDKLRTLKEWFGKVWGFVQEYVFPIIATLVGQYLQKVITVLGWVVEAIITVIGWYVSFYTEIGKLIGKIGEFLSAVKEKVGEALTFLGDVPDKVKGFFTNAATWLIDAGKNIVSGLWSGITSAWDGFVANIKSKVDGLPDIVKKVLGIASPSRVFMEIGTDVTAGLRKGIEDTTPSAVEVSRALAVSVAQGATLPDLSGPTLSAPTAQPVMVSSGSTVTIQPGAVQITVTNGEPDDVQAAVDEAFARLVRELQAR